MSEDESNAPHVVIENVTTTPEPVERADELAITDAALGVAIEALNEQLAAHVASYHVSAEEGARWQEMSEMAALRKELSQLREEVTQLREERESSSPSSSTPPPPSPPESPPASATAPESSLPGSSAPSAEAAPAAAPELQESAAGLSVAVQEAPKAEPRAERKRSQRPRFRRSLGKTARK